MPYSYPEIREFKGLYLQANSFKVPDGAMEVANNIVLSKDDVVSKCRGFYQYFAAGSALNSLHLYNDVLLSVASGSIGYHTDTGTAPNLTSTRTALTGTTVAVSGGRTSRSVQSNRNAYFTTNNGVVKIESPTSTVYQAGVPPALDLSGVFYGTGPILTGNSVAWRVLFGRRDSNDNLLLGAPSQVLQLTAVAASNSTRLSFSIPSDIVSGQGYFYQIYRSDQQAGGTAGTDFKLITEQTLTSTEITNRVAFYNDEVDDFLRGARLYTNTNTGEGETQANARPPLCDDVTLYKQMVVYGNCTGRHLLDVNLVDPTILVAGDYIEVRIGVGGTARKYVAHTGAGNKLIETTSVGTGTITITVTAHGFSNGYTVYVKPLTGTLAAEGIYTISGVTANTFDVNIGGGNTAPTLLVEGLTDGTDSIWYLNTAATAAAIDESARAIVKAVNRKSVSEVYAWYASGITEIPGKIRLQSKGFGSAIYLNAGSIADGNAFSPVLPSSPSTVFSRSDEQPNAFFVAKTNEPEAVPLSNFYPLGARNKEIQRVLALKDSLVVIKEDGVFRVTGDTPLGLSSTLLDGTIFCVAPKTAAVLNNQVIFLSNQGVCVVTESSVQVVSRKIEDVIQPIVGQDGIASVSAAVAYESERHFVMTTAEPNDTAASTTYVYNILNDSWVTWDFLFVHGVVGPEDTLYLLSTDDRILKERKNQTRIDFCGQNYTVTVVSAASDGLSAVITFAVGVTPKVGDIIVKGSSISRIRSVTLVSGTNFNVSFARQASLAASDSVVHYLKYDSTIKMSPFHAGLVGRQKQFSQAQLHTRTSSVSRIKVSFASYTDRESDEAVWTTQYAVGAGWGLFPWGSEPWGQEEGIDIVRETRAASPIRVYVPQMTQRSTYLQLKLVHEEAGEEINLQALAYSVRAYQERVAT